MLMGLRCWNTRGYISGVYLMDEHFLKDQIRPGVYLRPPTAWSSITGQAVEDRLHPAGNGISATAQRGKTRFLAVVMGSETEKERYDAARTLLDYGFNNFKGVPVIKKGTVVSVLPVDKGSPPEVSVVAAKCLSLLLPQGAEDAMRRGSYAAGAPEKVRKWRWR